MSDLWYNMLMKQITLRELLRNIKSVLPVPPEGVHVIRRDGEDFYLYPQPIEEPKNMSQTEIEQVAKAVDKLRQNPIEVV
jgi:hypothetical protein